jgi:hypothetical protein
MAVKRERSRDKLLSRQKATARGHQNTDRSEHLLNSVIKKYMPLMPVARPSLPRQKRLESASRERYIAERVACGDDFAMISART